jgi:hypothetical protein
MFVNFYKYFLYLLISLIRVSTDNIDLNFPIIFTHKESVSAAKLSEQNFGSYFGLSVNVNQENEENQWVF